MPPRYAEKQRVGSSWHQLEIMMNGCNWAKVGVWDKLKRNHQNAFSMMRSLGPAYSGNYTIAGELDVVVVEMFRWVKSASRGDGEVGFSQKRENGRQEETPKSDLVQYHSHASQEIDSDRVLLAGLCAHDALETFLGEDHGEAAQSFACKTMM